MKIMKDLPITRMKGMMNFWSEFPLLDECHFWPLGRPQKDVVMSDSWIDADAAGLTGWDLQMHGVCQGNPRSSGLSGYISGYLSGFRSGLRSGYSSGFPPARSHWHVLCDQARDHCRYLRTCATG
jgi:hypothetical protein